MIYNTSILAIYKNILSHYSGKKRKQELKKNIFNKNERTCRDVKTEKAWEQ